MLNNANSVTGLRMMHQAANFSIEEMNITGTNGEVRLQGEQAFKSFVPASKTLYTLTYR